MTHRLATKYLL